MKQSKKTVFFLHIPKTAGTTMNTILRRNFGKKNIAHLAKPYEHREELREALRKKKNVKLVSGHFPYGIHDGTNIDPAYFAVIRHPYERMYSYYKYILGTPTHYYHLKLKESGYTFSEFLSDPNSPEIYNQQVRLLSGCVAGPHETTEEIFDIAISNIEKSFVLLGLQDRFDETIALMKLKLGLRSIAYYSKNVSTVRKAYIPNEEEKLLLDKTNGYDLRLYEYAQAKFVEVISANKLAFEAAVNDLEKSNGRLFFRFYGRILESIDNPRRHVTKFFRKKCS